MNIETRFLYAIPLNGVTVTHQRSRISLAWRGGVSCAVRITPNAEGDIQLPGARHRALLVNVQVEGAGPLAIRTRLRGTGWLPAHTELWADHVLQPGANAIRVDCSEFALCQNTGTAGYLQLEWKAESEGRMDVTGLSCEELTAEEAARPLVDRFGQRKRGSWTGKVLDDTELLAAGEGASPIPMEGRDAYGGWQAGRAGEGTGFFRTEKRGDGWWLITPDGAPFLSYGPCCVTPGAIRTQTRGREHFYEELPPKEGVFLQAWQGAAGGNKPLAEMQTRASHGKDPDATVVNFAIANLIRKWGGDWFEQWSAHTVARLKHWGMNTMACWSDLELCQSAGLPYCLMADRLCPPPFPELFTKEKGSCFPLHSVPDVFHPTFETLAETWFEALRPFAEDTFLIGYFVGNEELWCLWHSPFALPSGWESRRVFLEELRERYGSIQALNEAWGSSFASFEQMDALQQTENPPGLSERGVRDCDDFLRRFADRYFSVVRRALRRADPHHLFLGCRFLALPPRDALLAGAAPHMDVVSINWYLWYKQSPPDAAAFLGRWHELCDGKPLLISEFSFTATDERLLACHLPHVDQETRARRAEDLIGCCQRLPFVVGMHWFQYIDQAITGRTLSDGERGNFGLVDIVDRPYPELTSVIQRRGRVLYAPRVDYRTHPSFNPSPETTARYEATIGRLIEVFRKDGADKSSLLAAARAEFDAVTPRVCRECFGIGSGYSLSKEFLYETLAANAACLIRGLVQAGEVAQAKALMISLYEDAFREGFTRDREFLANRLDSRTLMPLRHHLDAAYLKAIGFTNPRNVLLCVGDCQTVLLAEKLRDSQRFPGLDFASYQHEPGSLIDSPLNELLHPAAFFNFSKLAADYALLGRSLESRESWLQAARDLVDWLHVKQPRICVFVTHVFFGVENAVRKLGVPREVCEDAVGRFSDEVAEILAGAPNARLIHFQEICPYTSGTEPFRDDAEAGCMLHFRFDIMDAVHARAAAALAPLETSFESPIGCALSPIGISPGRGK